MVVEGKPLDAQTALLIQQAMSTPPSSATPAQPSTAAQTTESQKVEPPVPTAPQPTVEAIAPRTLQPPFEEVLDDEADTERRQAAIRARRQQSKADMAIVTSPTDNVEHEATQQPIAADTQAIEVQDDDFADAHEELQGKPKRTKTQTDEAVQATTQIYQTLLIVHPRVVGQICHRLLDIPVEQLKRLRDDHTALNDHLNQEILPKITKADTEASEGVFRLAPSAESTE